VQGAGLIVPALLRAGGKTDLGFFERLFPASRRRLRAAASPQIA
jgi:hypothetical protein